VLGKQELWVCFPNLQKSSTNWNLIDNFIFEYISEMWKRFSISYRDGRIIEMWKVKKSMEFFPTLQKSSTNWNVEDNFIWNTFKKLKCGRYVQYPTGWKNYWNVEGKLEHGIFPCDRKFHIQIYFWNVFNLNVEESFNILQGWKNYWNVEGKEELGIFSNCTEIFHKLKCGG
jgi:hypothetical protein